MNVNMNKILMSATHFNILDREAISSMSYVRVFNRICPFPFLYYT